MGRVCVYVRISDPMDLFYVQSANSWTYQWKMSLNSNEGPSKQTQEVRFSHTISWPSHMYIVFGSANVSQIVSSKVFEMAF